MDARTLCLGQEILHWVGQNLMDGDEHTKAFFSYAASSGALAGDHPGGVFHTIIIRNLAPENNALSENSLGSIRMAFLPKTSMC